ncbi:MAG: LysR family transcriptional regulator [Chloroflexi bacterium]|nr:LysR family transcriptional regulator [Chloroflexota bacterium]
MTDDDARAVAPGFQLQQLLYLREIERAGTLTAAAARLHVSQPALSQSLSQLERRLGVPLFERAGRRRVLTEAGREVARVAEEVLGRAAELEGWLEARRRGEAGVLRVGMIDAASLYVLPETIRRFRAEHAAVDLRLVVDTSAALLERLDGFALDLAFVVGPIEGAYAVSEVLEEPLYLYAPRGVAQRPEEGGWVLYPTGSQTRALIDAGLARAGLRPEVTLESSNPEILRQMVVLGLGWSVLPEAVAEAGSPPLARHGESPVARRTLLGVRRAAAAPDARAEAFLRLAGEARREGR